MTVRCSLYCVSCRSQAATCRMFAGAPVPARNDYFCGRSSGSTARDPVTLPSRADRRAAAAVSRRPAWHIHAVADGDAAAGDAAERSASAEGDRTAPEDADGTCGDAAPADEGPGRRPGGRSRGQPGLQVRWPGFGGDSNGGSAGASGDYGQSSWAKMMLSLPLEVAAAASRSDSHYLQKRKRKHWWSAESFPRVLYCPPHPIGTFGPSHDIPVHQANRCAAQGVDVRTCCADSHKHHMSVLQSRCG